MPDIRLVYLSCRAPHVTDAAVIDDIVLPSMAKNRRLDITGCLWFDRDRFLQTLEGPEETVDAVYSRIQTDGRHDQVTTMLREPLEVRMFSRWAMKPVSALRTDTIRDLVEGFGSRPQRCASGPAPTDPGGGAMHTIQRLLRMLATRAG